MTESRKAEGGNGAEKGADESLNVNAQAWPAKVLRDPAPRKEGGGRIRQLEPHRRLYAEKAERRRHGRASGKRGGTPSYSHAPCFQASGPGSWLGTGVAAVPAST